MGTGAPRLSAERDDRDDDGGEHSDQQQGPPSPAGGRCQFRARKGAQGGGAVARQDSARGRVGFQS